MCLRLTRVLRLQQLLQKRSDSIKPAIFVQIQAWHTVSMLLKIHVLSSDVTWCVLRLQLRIKKSTIQQICLANLEPVWKLIWLFTYVQICFFSEYSIWNGFLYLFFSFRFWLGVVSQVWSISSNVHVIFFASSRSGSVLLHFTNSKLIFLSIKKNWK